MKWLGIFIVILILVPTISFGQQIISEKQRGSEEISEYYNPEDVKLAMMILAVIVVVLFLYLARDTILRRKTEYEKKEYESKKNRDFEKYHSEWTGYDEDFFGQKKSKESREFRKMMQDSNLPNYYAVLGVNIDATHEQIKSKYRQLVKEYHPDRTKDEKSAEIFSEITKAYEVLSDDQTRKDYDKYYKASFG